MYAVHTYCVFTLAINESLQFYIVQIQAAYFLPGQYLGKKYMALRPLSFMIFVYVHYCTGTFERAYGMSKRARTHTHTPAHLYNMLHAQTV